ncbi:MAG: CHASE3 domain-containing protein [Proteobacteria bacterium]|nr:CHASE3 domain-containing protein [Pseudomonadota bacterium]
MMRPQDNFFMRNATAIALIAVSFLMAFAAFIFYMQGEVSQQAKKLVMHTHEVVGHIQALSNRITDGEVGLRGHLLSGSDIYLDPYRSGLVDSSDPRSQINEMGSRYSIAEEQSLLRGLTSDNPAQQKNLEEMSSAVKELQEYQVATFGSQKNKTSPASLWKTDSLRPKQLMDHIRRATGAMTVEEHRLMGVRVQADRKN